MKTKSILFAVASVFGACMATLLLPIEAPAQMFGNRALGNTLTQRGGEGMGPNAEAAGTLTGNERFLRQNRSSLDFVGRDAQTAQNFVGTLGNQGASAGEVRAAIDAGTREARGRTNVNRPRRAPRATGIYEPRLQVGFDVENPSSSELSSRLTARLENNGSIQRMGPVEVSMQGRTARLTGEVASERDRKLAEQMIRFEPGVSEVENELIVNALDTSFE